MRVLVYRSWHWRNALGKKMDVEFCLKLSGRRASIASDIKLNDIMRNTMISDYRNNSYAAPLSVCRRTEYEYWNGWMTCGFPPTIWQKFVIWGCFRRGAGWIWRQGLGWRRHGCLNNLQASCRCIAWHYSGFVFAYWRIGHKGAERKYLPLIAEANSNLHGADREWRDGFLGALSILPKTRATMVINGKKYLSRVMWLILWSPSVNEGMPKKQIMDHNKVLATPALRFADRKISCHHCESVKYSTGCEFQGKHVGRAGMLLWNYAAESERMRAMMESDHRHLDLLQVRQERNASRPISRSDPANYCDMSSISRFPQLTYKLLALR